MSVTHTKETEFFIYMLYVIFICYGNCIKQDLEGIELLYELVLYDCTSNFTSQAFPNATL